MDWYQTVLTSAVLKENDERKTCWYKEKRRTPQTRVLRGYNNGSQPWAGCSPVIADNWSSTFAPFFVGPWIVRSISKKLSTSIQIWLKYTTKFSIFVQSRPYKVRLECGTFEQDLSSLSWTPCSSDT